MSEIFKMVEGERFEFGELWFPSSEEHFRFNALKINTTELMEKNEVVQMLFEKEDVHSIKQSQEEINRERTEAMIEEAIYKDRYY